MRHKPPLRLAACVLIAVTSSVVRAGPPSEVLSTDLGPLIERAVSDPNRFAVEVPHAVDLSHGEWSTVGARSVWRYSLRIPTAVSLSFHATSVYLPSSAELRVSTAGAVYGYSAKDVNRGEIWSRIARGDSLALELSVATSDVRQLLPIPTITISAGKTAPLWSRTPTARPPSSTMQSTVTLS
jgi:hypothetical protein